nr:glycoside hydrolase family 52 protein [Niveibacterium umoris]
MRFINAHHSPLGAFASFTLGYPGASGGFDLERGQPPKEPVFVMLESANAAGSFDALPFCDAMSQDEAARFSTAHDDLNRIGASVSINVFPDEAIRREFGIARDSWRAGDLRFTVLTPALSAPDPDVADEAALKAAFVPAVYVEIEVDNSNHERARRVAFGYAGSDPYRAMCHMKTPELVGVGQGREVAILTDAPGAWSGIGFHPGLILGDALVENRGWALGQCGLLVAEVAPRAVTRLRYAIGFHRAGIVTSGIDASYLYTRWFDSAVSAARFALDRFDEAAADAADAEANLRASALSEEQRFMLAHATRAYLGSTQLLQRDGRPLWVVNEGEYRMINTFDLTVDHLFHELAHHPWAVRNVLDLYRDHYSYRDRTRLPGDSTEYDGGIAFTHDMGVANVFSARGHSCYERSGLSGCFSQMTHEQLTNWVLCAGAYVEQTDDEVWLRDNAGTLFDCLQSMILRDHPDAEQRDGVMHADSSRCSGGAEITTYDSLDTSLGQARANTYLAGKCWASYLALERLLTRLGRSDAAAQAALQARRCAETLVAAVQPDGTLPAVLEPGTPGFASRIIPAIEGLVYPWFCGRRDACNPDGPYGAYVKALRTHLDAVLKEGVCLFADGGWKLSASSDNSWLSKIYLAQFVARKILGMPASRTARSDRAHAAWLVDPRNAFWSWSDQIEAGYAIGSKYYPRGVTASLWLKEATD